MLPMNRLREAPISMGEGLHGLIDPASHRGLVQSSEFPLIIGDKIRVNKLIYKSSGPGKRSMESGKSRKYECSSWKTWKI